MDIHIKPDLSIFSKIGEWFSSIDPLIWQMAGCVLVVVFGAYAVMSYDDAKLAKLERDELDKARLAAEEAALAVLADRSQRD
jgi:hypothetical protein